MDARDALIESFSRCIEREPFDRVTVKEIYTGAGLSKKTYYNYFNSKEELVKAIIKRDFQEPIERIHSNFFGEELRNSNKTLSEMLFRTFYSKRVFYDSLIMTLGEERFTTYFAESNLASSRKMYQFNTLTGKQKLEIDFMLHLFSAAGAAALLWWRHTSYAATIEEMGNLYNEWVLANVSRRPEIGVLFTESARK